MEKKRNQAQIIEMPYKLVPSKELLGCDDDNVLCFQLRLYAVEQIRLIQAGKLTAKNVASNLRNINQSLFEFGKPTLDLSFLDEQPMALK